MRIGLEAHWKKRDLRNESQMRKVMDVAMTMTHDTC